MKKEKTLETILTLVTAFIVCSLIFKVKLLLTIAIILGLIGMFIKPLSEIISKLWLKLSEILGTISSKILLSAVYIIFLIPIALVYRIFNKNALLLKNTNESTFFKRNHKYTKTDFEFPW